MRVLRGGNGCQFQQVFDGVASGGRITCRSNGGYKGDDAVWGHLPDMLVNGPRWCRPVHFMTDTENDGFSWGSIPESRWRELAQAAGASELQLRFAAPAAPACVLHVLAELRPNLPRASNAKRWCVT